MRPVTVGSRLGRYQLRRSLGRGGEGEVFLAVDTRDGRHVAVKVIVGGVSSDNSERAHREASFIASLADPNIVRILALGHHQHTWYIVMEYVDGGSIHDYVRAHGRLDPAWALRLVAEAASALHAAHKLGVLHFDVTPKNMLFDRETRSLRLADFGLAQLMQPHRGTGFIGTPQYTAPEVWSGGAITPKVDSYSLGLSLYYLLVGTPAVSARALNECQQAHSRGRFDIPAAWPEALRTLFLEVTARRPERRLSARDFQRRAIALLDTWSAPTHPVTPSASHREGSPEELLSELARAVETGTAAVVLFDGNRSYRRWLVERALSRASQSPPPRWLPETRSEGGTVEQAYAHKTLIVSADAPEDAEVETGFRWKTPNPDWDEVEAFLRTLTERHVELPVLLTSDAVRHLAAWMHQPGPGVDVALASAEARRRRAQRRWLGLQDLPPLPSYALEPTGISLDVPGPLLVKAPASGTDSTFVPPPRPVPQG